jgi:hypothetical protein
MSAMLHREQDRMVLLGAQGRFNAMTSHRALVSLWLLFLRDICDCDCRVRGLEEDLDILPFVDPLGLTF